METTQKYAHLRAFFESYDIVECWCGYGGADVVAAYITQPESPDRCAQLWRDQASPDAEQWVMHYTSQFLALRAVQSLSARERKTRLAAEVDDLLESTSDEASRRTEIVSVGGEQFLDYSEFWDEHGDEVPMEDRTRQLLMFLRKQAESVIEPT